MGSKLHVCSSTVVASQKVLARHPAIVRQSMFPKQIAQAICPKQCQYGDSMLHLVVDGAGSSHELEAVYVQADWHRYVYQRE